MPPASPIDPRSDAIVLFYNGGPTPRDVPARDLHGGDLARVLYVRAHVNLETGRPKPATPAQLEALATELSGFGSWTRQAEPVEETPIVEVPTPEAPAPPAEPEAAP
jgi:hypothetical protein